MKNILLLIAAIVSIAIALVILVGEYFDPYAQKPQTTTSSFQQTLVLGELALGYPGNFSLAASNSGQLPPWPVSPCGLGFDYCLYYPEGVDGAGGGSVRINRRNALSEQDDCLSSPPLGISDYTTRTLVMGSYSTSLWTGLSSATASSSEEMYRVHTRGGCYEFELRAINTGDPNRTLRNLRAVMDSLLLPKSKEKIRFPY